MRSIVPDIILEYRRKNLEFHIHEAKISRTDSVALRFIAKHYSTAKEEYKCEVVKQ